MIQRNVEAGHKSCMGQLLRPKRLDTLTEKRSASADHGVRPKEYEAENWSGINKVHTSMIGDEMRFCNTKVISRKIFVFFISALLFPLFTIGCTGSLPKRMAEEIRIRKGKFRESRRFVNLSSYFSNDINFAIIRINASGTTIEIEKASPSEVASISKAFDLISCGFFPRAPVLPIIEINMYYIDKFGHKSPRVEVTLFRDYDNVKYIKVFYLNRGDLLSIPDELISFIENLRK